MKVQLQKYPNILQNSFMITFDTIVFKIGIILLEKL